MLSEEVRELLVNKLICRVNPSFIVVFGSYAKGTARAESDIDLAYFGETELSSYERFILAAELAELAGHEVDLVDIRKIDTVFTMQIFEQGVPIFIQDESDWVCQKMRAYSMYAELNERRAPVIEAIKERGSVFGDE